MRSPPLLAVLIASAGCSLALAGCSSDDLLAELPDAAPPDATPTPDACVSAGSHIIYLNRTPTTLRPGPNDSVANTTGLVTSEMTSVGPTMLSDADWQAIVACATEELGPFDIQVTDQDPGAVDHLEVLVSQSGADLGWPADYAGVFPASCPAGGPRELLLVFGGIFGNVHNRAFCEMMLTGIGQVAGLSYDANCLDMQFPNHSDSPAGCGPKHFLPEPSMCVDPAGAPMPCRCGGTTQSSYDVMLGYFGGNQCAQ